MMGGSSLRLPYVTFKSLDCDAPIDQRQQRKYDPSSCDDPSFCSTPPQPIFLSYRDINSASPVERSAVVSYRVMC